MDEPIPHFLNKPDKVVFWTWFELSWFLGSLFLVWIAYSFLLGLLTGTLVVKGLKVLQKHPLGDLTKIGPYWFLNSKKYQALPPACIREWIG